MLGQLSSYFPFPNRKDLMSLSTINEADAPKKLKRWFKSEQISLKTSDIDGAKPYLRGYEFINKPDFINFTEDIDRTKPARLHQPLNKPYFSLMTHDIDKATPKKGEFITTRIGTNPLQPVYNLPSFEIRPVTPPKFVRDQIAIDDIKGTKPEKYFKWAQRDNMNVRDIEGAKPKPERHLVKPNFMDTRDITKSDSSISNRVTNPLDPEYIVKNEEGKVMPYGFVDGSKPRKLIKTEIEVHRSNLNTDDIDGARPGTVGVLVRERRQQKDGIGINDIDKSQSGSLKRGISTNRKTNPLNPVYTWQTEEVNQEANLPVNEASKKPGYKRCEENFWGVTPSPSTKPSARPHTAAPQVATHTIDPDFTRNLNKFYLASPTGTPAVMEQELKINTEKFFNNSGSKDINPNSPINNLPLINKQRPPIPRVDLQSEEYQKNSAAFFDAQSNGSLHSNNNSSESKRLYSAGSRPKSSLSIDQKNYKFGLSRADIGRPSDNILSQTEAKAGTPVSRPRPMSSISRSSYNSSQK
ncbi:unnamed protein product [Blepharisma stoltei]|uniref:Uncharacterized protein n=1 Tax=Blepharisma stoltei TaxID=1481888 RepID=A0AAU9IK04_9CILI|nr:unnamed protein product [Blepharisma stoltei]